MCKIEIKEARNRLDVQFSTSPVSSLSIVTDGVVGSQSDPLWQWTVGVSSLGQSLLGLEGFLRLEEDVSNVF
jgi:hypothetical protein